MGIHYDYKSTRNEKAMKKEAKRKARIEERRAKKGTDTQNEEEIAKIKQIFNQFDKNSFYKYYMEG